MADEEQVGYGGGIDTRTLELLRQDALWKGHQVGVLEGIRRELDTIETDLKGCKEKQVAENKELDKRVQRLEMRVAVIAAGASIVVSAGVSLLVRYAF